MPPQGSRRGEVGDHHRTYVRSLVVPAGHAQPQPPQAHPLERNAAPRVARPPRASRPSPARESPNSRPRVARPCQARTRTPASRPVRARESPNSRARVARTSPPAGAPRRDWMSGTARPTYRTSAPLVHAPGLRRSLRTPCPRRPPTDLGGRAALPSGPTGRTRRWYGSRGRGTPGVKERRCRTNLSSQSADREVHEAGPPPVRAGRAALSGTPTGRARRSDPAESTPRDPDLACDARAGHLDAATRPHRATLGVALREHATLLTSDRVPLRT
jgi:hypothetical protein